LIPPNRKIAFILCGGEITFFNLPSLSYFKTLIKDKNSADIFINIDDPKCDNMLLVVNKKKRIKVYDFEYSSGNAVLNEQKTKDTIQIEDLPNCAVWTTKNNFIYSTSLKTLWLDLNTGKSTLVEFERTVQIINLEDKIALSNTEMTLFMKDGGAFQFNPITHVVYGGIDFQGFSMFKNHLIALYKNAVHIYKKGEQNYDFVESIDFGGDGSGRFLVTSNYKVIIVTEVGNKFNISEDKVPISSFFVEKKGENKSKEEKKSAVVKRFARSYEVDGISTLDSIESQIGDKNEIYAFMKELMHGFQKID